MRNWANVSGVLLRKGGRTWGLVPWTWTKFLTVVLACDAVSSLPWRLREDVPSLVVTRQGFVVDVEPSRAVEVKLRNPIGSSSSSSESTSDHHDGRPRARGHQAGTRPSLAVEARADWRRNGSPSCPRRARPGSLRRSCRSSAVRRRRVGSRAGDRTEGMTRPRPSRRPSLSLSPLSELS